MVTPPCDRGFYWKDGHNLSHYLIHEMGIRHVERARRTQHSRFFFLSVFFSDTPLKRRYPQWKANIKRNKGLVPVLFETNTSERENMIFFYYYFL